MQPLLKFQLPYSTVKMGEHERRLASSPGFRTIQVFVQHNRVCRCKERGAKITVVGFNDSVGLQSASPIPLLSPKMNSERKHYVSRQHGIITFAFEEVCSRFFGSF